MVRQIDLIFIRHGNELGQFLKGVFFGFLEVTLHILSVDIEELGVYVCHGKVLSNTNFYLVLL